LPIVILASLLPMIAALPIVAWSLQDYLKTALWYPLMTASLALGIRSLAGAFGGLAPRSSRTQQGQGRSVALALVLLASALANPAPVVSGNGIFVTLYKSKLAVLVAGEARLDMPLASGSGLTALAAAAAALAFAALAAFAEDAARRGNRGPRVSSGWHFQEVWSARPLVAAVDRNRDAVWSMLAFLVLAVLSLQQKAAPVVPLVVAAATIVIRSGSALAFIATEGPSTKRFALIPARTGRVDRAYLSTALALAVLMVAPLLAAGLMLMDPSFR